ncbi:unnamed protein product [Ceratitis capitata]|uniref:(Mediterranean fruit fly) hypothetical protein n=1 Tax=Ceratitis capitata TaxID=7213 RepID=A0A811UI77_CERCA|nr:unnamed protein product [Ceratitis capitata]
MIRLREHIQPQVVDEQNVTVQPAQRESSLVSMPLSDSTDKLYDYFNATTDVFGYSLHQNLMRLQKCLLGPAKEAVVAKQMYNPGGSLLRAKNVFFLPPPLKRLVFEVKFDLSYSNDMTTRW